MYSYYCLAATVLIIISAMLIYFYVVRKDRKNLISLVFCTVLSEACAILIPLLARLLIKELYFSVFIAFITSFVLLSGLFISIYIICLPIIYKIIYRKLLGETAGAVAVAIIGNDATDFKSDEGAIINTNAVAAELASGTDEIRINKDDIKMNDEGIHCLDEKAGSSGSLSISIPICEDAFVEAPDDDVPEKDNTDIIKCIEKAMTEKDKENYEAAIFLLEAALLENSDKELCMLIIADLCSLYRKTNQNDYIAKIKEYISCKMLNMEIKEGILFNL